MSYQTYGIVRYPYLCRTELTEVSGTGIDVVRKFPKRPVPVLMCTELTEVSGTGNTGGTHGRYAAVRGRGQRLVFLVVIRKNYSFVFAIEYTCVGRN